MDIVTDALILKEDGVTESIFRIMNYGEFLTKYFKSNTIEPPFDSISYLFFNFHPHTTPVLWRILVAQTFIYRLIIETYRSKEQSASEISNKISKLVSANIEDNKEYDWKKYDWRNKDEIENISPEESAGNLLELQRHT